MKWKICNLLAGIVVFAFCSRGGITEAGIVTKNLPLSCYTEHFVNTYEYPESPNIVDSVPAKVTNILIKEIRPDGWAYGKYRGSSGDKVYNWFKISDLCADVNYVSKEARVKVNRQKVTRTRNSKETIGVATVDDSALVIAEYRGMAQIVYKAHIGTAYNMGWVPIAALEFY